MDILKDAETALRRARRRFAHAVASDEAPTMRAERRRVRRIDHTRRAMLEGYQLAELADFD